MVRRRHRPESTITVDRNSVANPFLSRHAIVCNVLSNVGTCCIVFHNIVCPSQQSNKNKLSQFVNLKNVQHMIHLNLMGKEDLMLYPMYSQQQLWYMSFWWYLSQRAIADKWAGLLEIIGLSTVGSQVGYTSVGNGVLEGPGLVGDHVTGDGHWVAVGG